METNANHNGRYGEPFTKKRKLSMQQKKKKTPQQNKKNKVKKNNNYNGKRYYYKKGKSKKQQQEALRIQSCQNIEDGIKRMKRAIEQAKYWNQLNIDQQMGYLQLFDDKTKKMLKGKYNKNTDSIKSIQENMDKYLSSQHYKQAWKVRNPNYSTAISKSDFILSQVIPPSFKDAFDNGTLPQITQPILPSILTIPRDIIVHKANIKLQLN